MDDRVRTLLSGAQAAEGTSSPGLKAAAGKTILSRLLSLVNRENIAVGQKPFGK